MKKLSKILNLQIDSNIKLNLFFENLDNVININKEFKAEILSLKKGSVNLFAMADVAVKVMAERVYSINQYIQLSEENLKELKDIYIITYTKLNQNNFDEVMRQHFKSLSVWLADFYPENYIKLLRSNPRLGTVVNSEYSTDFITEIYDVKLTELNEPVLDIGCGKNAGLVSAVKVAGKDVLGIDRLLNVSIDEVKEQSWMDFDFKSRSWGTIFANMSFTNHLVYVLKNNRAEILNYFLKYKEIIESLKVGGIFYYAPSLEFIEQRLDSNYYLVNRRIINGTGVSMIKKKKGEL
ncbi:MAG: class I SAM-dependent methyltransferase [Spirochaetales bacterium]|nr:class I SAM-dependent methyltransferase [Spirochaetales bacterium]